MEIGETTSIRQVLLTGQGHFRAKAWHKSGGLSPVHHDKVVKLQIFGYFSPLNLGKMNPILTVIFFQMGW